MSQEGGENDAKLQVTNRTFLQLGPFAAEFAVGSVMVLVVEEATRSVMGIRAKEVDMNRPVFIKKPKHKSSKKSDKLSLPAITKKTGKSCPPCACFLPSPLEVMLFLSTYTQLSLSVHSVHQMQKTYK